MSNPPLGFVQTQQGTHVQVTRKGDRGVSLLDLRTMAAIDLDARNLGVLLELLEWAAMPGQPSGMS